MVNRDLLRFLVLGAVIVAALVVGQLLWTGSLRRGPGRLPGETTEEIASAIHVGRAVCVECHAREDSSWAGSDHARAMMVPSDESVVAAFDGRSFDHFGVNSTFFRKGREFWVETDGPDGNLQQFRVAYTFGIEPLQQFLLPLPGGRLQALNVCWDTRPAEEGGQRWFHLYPEHPTPSTDLLHWTRRYQNWNFSCAECHSTHLQKNYDPETDTYSTSYSEVDVSCEACHGPGSVHVEWARALESSGREADPQSAMGLVVRLKDPHRGGWVFAEGESIAARSAPLLDRRELQVCAPCHSRRSVVDDTYRTGDEFLDHYRPVLLEERFYFADGQILDEVYVYGSFLQSRMYRAGVSCSDCHDTHSYRLVTDGDTVCSKCHHPAKYASASHHFHPEGRGDGCLDCHMVARDYMVVDPRRDHSFRSPRPDLSAELGVPNACNHCHVEKSPAWSMEWMDRWYGEDWRRRPEFARAFDAARKGSPAADRELARVSADTASFNAIVRATAIRELENFPGEISRSVLNGACRDPDPLVRMAAAEAANWMEEPARIRLLAPLLEDSVRVVRVSAGRSLAAVPESRLPAALRVPRDAAVAEYVAEQELNADRSSSMMKLGALRMEQGDRAEAERLYRRGIELEPRFAATYINLADLYRAEDREHEAEQVLRRALERVSDEPALYYALGLSLVRQRRYAEAEVELGEAARLRPEEMGFVYAHAASLEALGRGDAAHGVLLAAHERNEVNGMILRALVENAQRRGERSAADEYDRRLRRLLR